MGEKTRRFENALLNLRKRYGGEDRLDSINSEKINIDKHTLCCQMTNHYEQESNPLQYFRWAILELINRRKPRNYTP